VGAAPVLTSVISVILINLPISPHIFGENFVEEDTKVFSVTDSTAFDKPFLGQSAFANSEDRVGMNLR
jgi:hypothetical protein